MAKRSPNYPSLTLEQASEKARKVYEQEHTHAAPREVVAQALGYTGLNGASLSVIAAIAAYGLLEKAGTGSLKISPDAVSVFELDEGHPQRCQALERLAFTPKLFAELKERFGSELPSDINLKHFLIQEKDFLPKAAADVIRVYRANLELVTDGTASYDGGPNAKSEEKPPMSQQMRVKSSESIVLRREHGGNLRPEVTSGAYEFSFPLSLHRDIKATILISGSSELRRRDIEFLKRKVGDILEGFEEEEGERKSESKTRRAIWRNKDHDQPVTIIGELGEKDGKRFFAAKETDTGIPEDELEFAEGAE